MNTNTFSVEAPQNQNDISTAGSQQKSSVVFTIATANFNEDENWTISDLGNSEQPSSTNNSESMDTWTVKATSMIEYNDCTTNIDTCLENVVNTGIFYRHDWLPQNYFLVDTPSNISCKSELLSYIEKFLEERGFEVYIGENENISRIE
ncbi:MAG: hypothetical protein ACTSUK_11050 [Promethearchaeota archaeon]